ncbi:hypothetical protein [Burkholderia alba]|uniref:hypothetical protein n=1 Tax=Burkholderia alba TaxID=2683677 RepID=UPI002B055010|nr:hypothetical protein [Burkholderia alba]
MKRTERTERTNRPARQRRLPWRLLAALSMLPAALLAGGCNGDGTDAAGPGAAGMLASRAADGAAAAPAGASTPAGAGAWDGKTFQVDRPNVVARSNIVLGQPNLAASQAMPLGNGRLGVAVWSANGLTAQLNRADTLPKRYSPGQVVIPGLAALTSATDYAGRLDLYNGEFRESGGGMTATAYVQPDTDALIVDVTGADPARRQTAMLKLWSPRTPSATLGGTAIGVLSQSWTDGVKGDANGSSGRAFGALSAITAQARNVSASVTDPLTVTVTFTPNADGTFRIVAGAPRYDGSQPVPALAAASVADTSPSAHATAWHTFWSRAGLIKLTSSDGSGEYMENLRNIYLYSSAAENKDVYPGSQAGVADLFSSVQDTHQWDASAYWHWNLRMQVAANLSAGLPELNAPYFNLYQSNLAAIGQWTTANMAGRDGACVPETMRFNGAGIENETWLSTLGYNCSASSGPYYNARTLSTGAEVSHAIWTQYLATGDLAFLAQNYPVMEAAARFMLAYQSAGTDKLLHTSPTNAHETQWDVKDSTTDLAAIRALYADTLGAGKVLAKVPGQSVDAALAAKMSAALPHTPDYPRTQPSGSLTLLTAAADAAGADVIAMSYQPAAASHNSENIGLEPVWPYDQIGDASPLYALAKRTYANRPNKTQNDWSFDPIHAARLGLPAEVKSTLVTLTGNYQKFPSGFANFVGSEPYVEQIGVVATTLAESLVQDYDGLIRIAPAIPAGWDYDGTVYVRGNTRVDVQVRGGVPATVVIEPGSNADLTVRNPWPGAKVIASSAGFAAPLTLSGTTLTLKPVGGSPILLQSVGAAGLPAASVSGKPATAARHLGTTTAQIGL